MNTPNIAMPGASLSSQASASGRLFHAVFLLVRPARVLGKSPDLSCTVGRCGHLSVWLPDQHDFLCASYAWRMAPGCGAQHMRTPYEMSAALIMGLALIVGIFYSLDALYGERRDRSILFWKSMPVSDLTTVLSKWRFRWSLSRCSLMPSPWLRSSSCCCWPVLYWWGAAQISPRCGPMSLSFASRSSSFTTCSPFMGSGTRLFTAGCCWFLPPRRAHHLYGPSCRPL